jgi:predicted outer membrane repeat protein
MRLNRYVRTGLRVLAIVIVFAIAAGRDIAVYKADPVVWPKAESLATGMAAQQPNTREVVNTNDDGAGSLREAVSLVSPGGNVLISIENATITLTSGEIVIDKDLTIGAPSSLVPSVAVSAGNMSRVFRIVPGVHVKIFFLAIKDGNTDFGGAILNQGTLELFRSTVSNSNATKSGGGIRNEGELTMNFVTVSENSATGDGGGISNSGTGTLTMNKCTVSGNSAGSGGGISSSGKLTITDCTVSGNSAAGGGVGGGILNSGNAELTMTNCTVSGNSAEGDGGGIFNSGQGIIIRGCTISENEASKGGGIMVTEPAAISDCLISGNRAGAGGGILNGAFKFWVLVNCIVSGNSASGDGGGIFNRGDLIGTFVGNLSLASCRVSENSAGGSGGGISNLVGLAMDNCTVSRNSATGSGSSGGGISNSGRLTMTNCTVSENSATGSGGGISNGGESRLLGCAVVNNSAGGKGGGISNLNNLTVINCTVSGNAVLLGGGGLHNTGALRVTNCTVVENVASIFGSGGRGGGILNENGGSLTINNTIVANNIAGSGPDVEGSVDSGTFNLIRNTSGITSVLDPSNVINQDPRLVPLGDYGGPTPTHALRLDSPAVDAGNNDLAVDQQNNPLATDQRGEDRIVNSRVDIGAFEGRLFLIPLSLPDATLGCHYPQQEISTVGLRLRSDSWLRYFFGSLPPGFFGFTSPPFSPQTKLFIGGTPTRAGSFSFVVKVAEGDPSTLGTTIGFFGASLYEIRVNPETEAPVISRCPDIVVGEDSFRSGKARVNYTTPTATDNCSVTVTCDPAPGSEFSLGRTTVTCTAIDPSGNSSQCSFVVTVVPKYDTCIQDDSDRSKVLWISSITGEYLFCCGSEVFSGKGQVIRKGNLISLQDLGVDRRLSANVDLGFGRGSASLQFPPGRIKCTIMDRNIRDNDCSSCGS